MNPGPLTGYRILDLSRVLSGPAATMLLADQGADVIKIEPHEGDITRQMGVGGNGMTSFFVNINRGKRGMALDLKSDDGIEICRRLVKNSDVLVQNFRPGAIERLGLGVEDVRKIREDIIYVSISGFGKQGPYAHQRVYDPVIQALSGITDIQAGLEDDRPRMFRTIIPDKTTALTAAQAITAALLKRERTGEAQTVDVAMLDATIAYLWPEGMSNITVVDGSENAPAGQIAQELIFKTLDGYITAGAMSDAEWVGLCDVLERPEWVKDPRYLTTALRFKNSRPRLTAIAEIFATKTNAEWLKKLDVAGVPSAPVLRRLEMVHHEQTVMNEIIREYDHPGLGRIRQPRPAAQFDGIKVQNEPVAPSLGEHNHEILHELGYDEADIARFASNNTIAQS